jgi:hypothetical protein
MEAVSNRMASLIGTGQRRLARPYAPENSVRSPRRIRTTPENSSAAARALSQASSSVKGMP